MVKCICNLRNCSSVVWCAVEISVCVMTRSFCETDRKEGSDSTDARRKLNCREKILTPLSSQFWHGDIIFEAMDVKQS